MIDGADSEGRALNFKRVTGPFLQILRQQVAEHDFGMAVAEGLARKDFDRREFVGVGPPAVGQGVDVLSEIHDVVDHRRGICHHGQSADFVSQRLIERCAEKGLLDDCNVCPAAGVEPQPPLLKGARETHQAHECPNGHSDSAKSEESSQPATAEVLPYKSGERELSCHGVAGVSSHSRRF